MVHFACLMAHPSIKRKLGNTVTHSKTCITGKWMETWIFSLFREIQKDRQKDTQMDYKLLTRSSTPFSDAQNFADAATIATLKSLGLWPWLGKAPGFFFFRPQVFIEVVYLAFLTYSSNPGLLIFWDRNYLYDHSLWNSVCLEPSKAVIWHVSFFSTLLCISLLQILLVVIHLINSFLGLFYSLCEKW